MNPTATAGRPPNGEADYAEATITNEAACHAQRGRRVIANSSTNPGGECAQHCDAGRRRDVLFSPTSSIVMHSV